MYCGTCMSDHAPGACAVGWCESCESEHADGACPPATPHLTVPRHVTQLCGVGATLYALDGEGRVWRYRTNDVYLRDGWEPVESLPPIELDADGNRLGESGIGGRAAGAGEHTTTTAEAA